MHIRKANDETRDPFFQYESLIKEVPSSGRTQLDACDTLQPDLEH